MEEGQGFKEEKLMKGGLVNNINCCKREKPELESLYVRLKKAESLLISIKSTGSHHQVKESIDKYFNKRRVSE